MYKVLKEKGHNENIILENTDTKATLIVGKLSMTILGILADEGHTIDTEDGKLKLTDKWELPISEEGKKQLEKIAMRMSKPIKEPKKTEQLDKDIKKINKNIDAMDVLLGLASYN